MDHSVRVVRLLGLVYVTIYYPLTRAVWTLTPTMTMWRKMLMLVVAGFLIVDLLVLLRHVLRAERQNPFGCSWLGVIMRTAFYWWKGMSWLGASRASQWMIAQDQEGFDLYRRAQEEAPEIAERVHFLAQRFRLKEAKRTLAAALQPKRERIDRHAALLSQSKTYHVDHEVGRLLQAGDDVAAEWLIARARRLIEQAKQYDAGVHIAHALRTGAIDDAERLLQSKREEREKLGVVASFRARITKVLPEYRHEAEELLRALLSCTYGGRNFRKAEHALERRLAEMEAASARQRRDRSFAASS